MFFAAKLQKYFELCKCKQEKMLNFGNSHNFRSKIAAIFGKVQKNFFTHGGKVHRGGWSWRGRAAPQTADGSSDG